MGEKGMESPAPSRSGVAGAETVAGRMAGVSDMAAAGSSGTVTGGMDQGMGAGMGETLSTPIEQARGTIGQPPKG
jgi:hypothetical protein